MQYKFRGLRADGKGWVYGCLVNNLFTYSELSDYPKGTPVCQIITGEYEGDCWEDIYEDDGCIVDVIPSTVGMRYPHPDKDGNEIYPGDYMGSKYNVVEFNGCDWSINGDEPLWAWAPKHSVIGNIHQP